MRFKSKLLMGAGVPWFGRLLSLLQLSSLSPQNTGNKYYEKRNI